MVTSPATWSVIFSDPVGVRFGPPSPVPVVGPGGRCRDWLPEPWGEGGGWSIARAALAAYSSDLGMAEEIRWLDKLVRTLFSWLSRGEVKTPLSFFFKVVTALTVVAVAALLLVPAGLRYQIFLAGAALLLFFFIFVGLFAWLRPKNLVYGETGHRAETRLAFGTERREIAAGELATMEGRPNPRALVRGDQQT
jgi:hypothetical protein